MNKVGRPAATQRRQALAPAELRGLLPYNSVATTADLYVHVPPHVDQEAADRTADYIFRSGHLETGKASAAVYGAPKKSSSATLSSRLTSWAA